MTTKVSDEKQRAIDAGWVQDCDFTRKWSLEFTPDMDGDRLTVLSVSGTVIFVCTAANDQWGLEQEAACTDIPALINALQNLPPTENAE